MKTILVSIGGSDADYPVLETALAVARPRGALIGNSGRDGPDLFSSGC
jgi:hypothetical protein